MTWGGKNGWHVHSHEILFLYDTRQSPDFLEALRFIGEGQPVGMEIQILPLWQKACVSAGLSEPDHHGVKVQNAKDAGGYAAKWGMDLELTKAHTKRAREGNYSPWDMLREIRNGRHEFEDLFREYANAFKGRHQLQWSKGLRDLLCLGKEKTDGEPAAETDRNAVYLGSLTPEQWGVVLDHEKRGELLKVAAEKGWLGVVRFIRELVKGGGNNGQREKL